MAVIVANPNTKDQSDDGSVLPSSKPENQGETVDNPGTALARKQLRPYVEITAFREYLKEQILKWETWHQSQGDEIRMHESCRDHDKEQLENGIRQGTVDPDDPDDTYVLSYEWHKFEVSSIPKDLEFRLVAEGEPICFQEASIAAMVALFWCDINRLNMLVPDYDKQPDFDFLDPYGTFQKYLFEQREKPIQGRYKHIDWFVEAAIKAYESTSAKNGVGQSEEHEQSVAPVIVAADPQKEIRAEALAAVVAAGFPGMIQAAASLPAGDRIAEVMRSMCESDEMYYRWSADNWVEHLKAAKKTVTGCDAWGEIMQWREARKRSAMPVKSAKQIAESSRRKQRKKLAE